ncbi:MAG: hypothetical protein ABSH41_16140, partial [Syntrophobacteraceae bacterium]
TMRRHVGWHTVHLPDKYVTDLIYKDNAFDNVTAWRIKLMDTTSELIYLHNQIEWLCYLYIAIENKPDEKDVIQELKTKIMGIYSQIMSIRRESNPQSINLPVFHDGYTEQTPIFSPPLEIHSNDCYLI